MQTGGMVGELWGKHRGLAERVANEILDIQKWFGPNAHQQP